MCVCVCVCVCVHVCVCVCVCVCVRVCVCQCLYVHIYAVIYILISCLLCSDLIGQFDIVWDHGSFTAINTGDREKCVTPMYYTVHTVLAYLQFIICSIDVSRYGICTYV